MFRIMNSIWIYEMSICAHNFLSFGIHHIRESFYRACNVLCTNICSMLQKPQSPIIRTCRHAAGRQRAPSAPDKLRLFTVIIQLLCDLHSQSLAPVSERSQ